MSDFLKKASSKISKLSPEQIERLLDEAASKNSVFNSIIESLSIGLVIVDIDCCVLKINKAAQRLLFRACKVEKGTFLFSVLEDEKICAFLKETLDSKKTNVSREFSIDSHGKIHFVNISVMPFLGQAESADDFSASQIIGSIISIDDITEKREQEILMHRMESLASLTTLAASVAHEIKNPLGAISIHIQLLQKVIKKAREKDGKLPQEKFMENYLDVVNEEIAALNKIVMDFLFAVRPVHSSMELLDPDSIIEKTAGFFAPEFEQKKLSLNLELSSKKQDLLIDAKLFREVLVNLFQNAAAAMKDGGTLTVTSEYDFEKYTLIVRDTGCGMSEEVSSKIFEPYFTTKADGTGLGLTMVYKIIKEFRGDITVESRPGLGTAFKISLPVPQQKTMLLCHEESKK